MPAQTTFPEPSHLLADPAALFPLYLDFFRDTVATKVDGLSDDQLRTTVLPSGWTPLELVKHLEYMEQRWLRWGFLGEQVDEPWGDRDPEADRWSVRQGETVDMLLSALRAGGEHTSAVVRQHGLDELAADTGRFAGDEDTPTLSWILFHVLQEYARHVGHLDVVRELIDGRVGE